MSSGTVGCRLRHRLRQHSPRACDPMHRRLTTDFGRHAFPRHVAGPVPPQRSIGRRDDRHDGTGRWDHPFRPRLQVLTMTRPRVAGYLGRPGPVRAGMTGKGRTRPSAVSPVMRTRIGGGLQRRVSVSPTLFLTKF
jgi:hypothetical protein